MARRHLQARSSGMPDGEPDPRLEAMAPYLDRARPVVIHADSRPAIAVAIRFAARQRLRWILAGGREASRLAPVLARGRLCSLETRHTRMFERFGGARR